MLRTKFVQTENVRNFQVTMDAVKRCMGTDSLAMIWGRAGRGKTRTAKWYAVQHDCVFVESLRDWSVSWMLQDILKAWGQPKEAIPLRKKAQFERVVEMAQTDPKPIILDEADLVGARLLETIRDLCKMTCIPWVLVGEESLPRLMDQNRRVWSRRCAALEFKPISLADIVCLGKESAGVVLTPEAAEVIKRRTDDGDIRLVMLALARIEQIARASRTDTISAQMAETAAADAIPERRK